MYEVCPQLNALLLLSGPPLLPSVPSARPLTTSHPAPLEARGGTDLGPAAHYWRIWKART
jgi:hypothetical protein